MQTVPLEETLHLENYRGNESSVPQTQLEYQELRSLVHLSISKLSDRNQLVVTLYHIDGLAYREISDFLDLPISTIKSGLNKARHKLKEEVIKMVRSDLKSKPLPADVVEKIVQQALASANEYVREYYKALYRETAEQCDIALDGLGQLADAPQYLQWKAQAFKMKGDASLAHYPIASTGSF